MLLNLFGRQFVKDLCYNTCFRCWHASVENLVRYSATLICLGIDDKTKTKTKPKPKPREITDLMISLGFVFVFSDTDNIRLPADRLSELISRPRKSWKNFDYIMQVVPDWHSCSSKNSSLFLKTKILRLPFLPCNRTLSTYLVLLVLPR